MLIDLHCHTKSTKEGDGVNRNVSPELFRTKIELADVKIVAITNHNAFDIEQYITLRGAVSDLCQVWPGIEIDIECSEKKGRYHLIIVCNPDELEPFAQTVSDTFNGKNINEYAHKLEEICTAFSKLDTIYIPHFHNKKPAIPEDERALLKQYIGDDSRIFIEPRDHRTVGVLANNNFNVMIGSDVKDWNHYEKCTFAELRLPIGSFSELLLLSRRDSNVVKTLLSNKTPVAVIGRPHPQVEVNLSIYPDINILFGQKGTGKTELLKSMYTEMVKTGRNCRKYIASEHKEDFSALLSIKGVDAHLSKVQAKACEEEFNIIKKWSDKNPTSFEMYKNWIATRGNSNNKSRMKITEMVHLDSIKNEKYTQHKYDADSILLAYEKMRDIVIEDYCSPEIQKEFWRVLMIIRDSIICCRNNDVIDDEAVRLSNFSIDRIKTLADRNSDTVSRPSNCGILELAKNRIELHKAVNTILDELNCEEKNERQFLGSLEDKGKIYVNTKYRMLSPSSKANEFTILGINTLKKIRQKLEDINKCVFDEDVANKVDELKSILEENDITSIKPFLGISKQIITEDGYEYQPSNGEMGILLLQQALKDDADAYFLDEPELGMGNSYINSNIRPIISDLAKQRKFVLVATHNANIAVRTLPYNSILRTHENGKYKTFVGNPFDDRMVNVDDETEICSWAEESMNILEGGKEAFYERRDIYESKDN